MEALPEQPAMLLHAADRWSLGILPDEELPVLAIQALEQGRDSPKLRMLAGWTPAWTLERRRLFLDALAEFGITPGPRDVTLRRLARPIVEAAAAGTIPITQLADVLVETFGPLAGESSHPLFRLYNYAADYWLEGNEVKDEVIAEHLAREEAARLLLLLITAQPLEYRW